MVEDQLVLSEEDYTIERMRAKLDGIKPEKLTHKQTLDNKRDDEVDYERPETETSSPSA